MRWFWLYDDAVGMIGCAIPLGQHCLRDRNLPAGYWGPAVNETIRIEEPNMRTRPFDRILLASAALALFSGAANALTPTLELQVGPVASVPVTTGSISFGGVTVTGLPLVGSTEQPELQMNGSVSLGDVFNPLDVQSTEYNLSVNGSEASFVSSISGTLAPLTSVDWSVYYDPTNAPFGQDALLASGDFSNPSSSVTLGFSTHEDASGSIAGPFSLTEVLSIGGPTGGHATFDSSSVASVPEASTWAMLLLGFAGCGVVFHRAKRRQVARV
jgi:hypothetical protein